MSFIKETFPNDPENTPTLIPKKLSFRYTARIFSEFCQSTSLHGYSYLNNFSSLWLKLLWIFVILVMTGLSIAFLVSNTNEYFEARLVTNIESSSADLSVSIFITDKAIQMQLLTRLFIVGCGISVHNSLQFESSRGFIYQGPN